MQKSSATQHARRMAIKTQTGFFLGAFNFVRVENRAVYVYTKLGDLQRNVVEPSRAPAYTQNPSAY